MLYFPPDLFAEAVEEVAVRGETEEAIVHEYLDEWVSSNLNEISFGSEQPSREVSVLDPDPYPG